MRFNKKPDPWNIILILLLLCYVISMIWINFHSALWYRMDCYTYAYEGRLMYETKSFFPENWIFSNQFHIISSPNFAALFYGITKDSLSAMACASSFSIILVFFSFLWCFKPFIRKRGLYAGALCLLGGVILGTDAALYISGLQVLYTMCSYYSSYLIGILLSLGIWHRLHMGIPVKFWFILLVLLWNFALGMQSLREMLILVIPLFFAEVFYSIKPSGRGKALFHISKSSLFFVCSIFIAELAGHYFMESLHIPTTPNIGGLEIDIIPSHLIANLWASTKNLLRISGLAITIDGLKYLPLSICALCIASAVIYTVVYVFAHGDHSPLAMSIIFAFFSVLCVYGIGVFMMRTRDIYYFVYWLLATTCIIYLIKIKSPPISNDIIIILVVICCINYCYSFIPDFKDYKENHKKVEAFAHSLADRGIQVIYMDSMPIIAAASHDKIISQSYWFDIQKKSGYPLTFFPSDKYTLIYDDFHYSHSLICISNESREALEKESEKYKTELMDNLVLYDQITIRGNTYKLYQSKKRIICPPTSLSGQDM